METPQGLKRVSGACLSLIAKVSPGISTAMESMDFGTL
jgi:hypothetical protein